MRWVVFLRRLHEMGMRIQRMLAYAALARRGESTISERRALLEAHRDEVARKLAEQQAHLAGIDKKVRMYEELERQLAETSGRDAPAPERRSRRSAICRSAPLIRHDQVLRTGCALRVSGDRG